MKNRKYNILLLIIFMHIVFFISIFNFIIDPYAVFHNDNKFNVSRPNIDKNSRISRIPAFKLLKENAELVSQVKKWSK